ncbi:hypothetical protein F5884DRAFT_96464 [Xylogone sp. PMI_703]|nr:hypothetical protein F5884DRAFT_96464 [Xylogone sp. PMI_703]
MAAQPTEQDIDAFCGLASGISRSEAIARLKGNNNNVEQALNEYFDNTESSQYRWDESQFNTDREGELNGTGMSFSIQASDDLGPYGSFDTAPSRPPSRTSNSKSPLSKVIDLSADHITDARTSIAQSDRELEQALAASRAEAGLPPQETGITSSSQVYFGPATRSQYEQGKWDMVPIGKTSAQEILYDPEPAERKRGIDAPAFLKPAVEDHRLGALLTIYHEIPLAREIFLDRLDVLPEYGFDKEWWTGTAIEMSTVRSHGRENVNQEYDQFCRELQRLMAFLDKTERSYGSIEPLSNMRILRKVQRRGIDGSPIDVESAFFETWKKLTTDESLVRKLFSRGVLANETEEEESRDFAILDLSLPLMESEQSTIYDIADAILWAYRPTSLANSAYLSHIGEVIAFRLEGNEFSRNIEIPSVWYPDRYLKSGREAALAMRIQQNSIDEQLQSITVMENKLTHFLSSRGQELKVRDLFQASLQHDNSEIGQNNSTDILADTTDDTANSEKRPDLSAQLRKVMVSIDQKLKVLNEEKERLRFTLREVSKLYTSPSTDPEQPPHYKYTLRGISTTKNITYVCRQAEPDLISMDVDSASPKPLDEQWWRIEYGTSGSNPVAVQKTTLEKVLKSAKSESKNSILVYASEKAMQWPSKPLPTALEEFVLDDNHAFNVELDPTREFQSSQNTPKSPGKRKYQESEEEVQGWEDWNSQDMVGEAGSTILTQMATESISNDESRKSRAGSKTSEIRLPDRSVTPHGSDTVIIGVDPSLQHTGDNFSELAPPRPEMQERTSLLELTNQPQDSMPRPGIVDMDISTVLGDDNVHEESTAVKHVEFTE